MTQKDIIKLVLIMHGYDENIKIDSWKCEDDVRTDMFEVHATNTELDDDIYVLEPGLEMVLGELFKYFNEDYTSKYRNILYVGAYTSWLLDDNWRKGVKEEEAKRIKQRKDWEERNREYLNYIETQHPCDGCTKNKHDHWDDIHNNCALHHNMTCEILKKFMDDARSLIKN